MKKLPLYILLTAAAVVMIYPLLWLIGASFKSNDEIFSSAWFVPQSLDLSVYARAWRTVTPHTMGHYFVNTFLIIVPKTVLAVVSSVLVAYGFARFDFPLKRLFFGLLMGSMFMPAIVTVMPLYLMWSKLGLHDTYVPLTLPALFAAEGAFVFMLVPANSTRQRASTAAATCGCSCIYSCRASAPSSCR